MRVGALVGQSSAAVRDEYQPLPSARLSLVPTTSFVFRVNEAGEGFLRFAVLTARRDSTYRRSDLKIYEIGWSLLSYIVALVSG